MPPRPFRWGSAIRAPAPGHGRSSRTRANVAVYAPGVATLEVAYQAPGRQTGSCKPCRTSTDGVHHGIVDGIPAGSRYGFRAAPRTTRPCRSRCPPWILTTTTAAQPLLLDPYGRAVDEREDSSPASGWPPTSTGARTAGRSVPWRNTIVYEAHVRGQTMLHPDIPETLRGTYAGMAHPAMIEHLTGLGITAVQLLPVHFHRGRAAPAEPRADQLLGLQHGRVLRPAPRLRHPAPPRQPAPQAVQDEFKGMVKLLHAAGLEVILDVVYNHTAEGGPDGPSPELPRAGRDAVLPQRRPRQVRRHHGLRQHA